MCWRCPSLWGFLSDQNRPKHLTGLVIIWKANSVDGDVWGPGPGCVPWLCVCARVLFRENVVLPLLFPGSLSLEGSGVLLPLKAFLDLLLE